jgi:hypothetical protein
MQIEILEDKEEYKRLHELVFKQSDITVPDVVFIGRNSSGRTVGFVSGFWNSDDHFYIQWAGVLPAYQKRGYLRYFSAILKDDVTYDNIKNCVVCWFHTDRDNTKRFKTIYTGSKGCEKWLVF